jgi:hypothetical protein
MRENFIKKRVYNFFEKRSFQNNIIFSKIKYCFGNYFIELERME